MEASKWLQVQALLDEMEIVQLLDSMGDFHLYPMGALLEKGNEEISREKFFECYGLYIAALREGKVPQENDYRPTFTGAFTVDPDMVRLDPVADSRQIVRVMKPVIQLLPHRLGYSVIEEKFRPMVKGKESITWGIQFAYPQLFEEEGTIYKVDESDMFPNTKPFRILQKWMRQNTVPTPFVVQGKKINVPIRLGKQCFSWINKHPHLIQKGITVWTL